MLGVANLIKYQNFTTLFQCFLSAQVISSGAIVVWDAHEWWNERKKQRKTKESIKMQQLTNQ